MECTAGTPSSPQYSQEAKDVEERKGRHKCYVMFSQLQKLQSEESVGEAAFTEKMVGRQHFQG